MRYRKPLFEKENTEFNIQFNGDFKNVENISFTNKITQYNIWAGGNEEVFENFPKSISKMTAYDLDYCGDYKSAVEDKNGTTVGEDVLWWCQNAVYHNEPYMWEYSKIVLAELEDGREVYLRMDYGKSVFAVLGKKGFYTY